ncbi:aldo/keto reductase family protein [Galdieria sulphuraria]|uniref:Aldo/keto reductase family protein n=1 Tax=Galdieria sulphuraria TaxID=130081 RepID=M2Y808_GALSU|nr:aldo/keto reductase family protein [Galdieria sulphuraria]EME32208.1 aldo/keto reductase family protein [Galdieria sulphuraria]|eukprot:XP_005708728.1 aldo/keto reductase family protein [Galdieria sulphuraria]
MQYSKLGEDLTISKLVTGMWQLSGAHGYIPSTSSVVTAMKCYTDYGVTTFDLADHYGDAEIYVGEFRKEVGKGFSDSHFQFLTKWVPRPGLMSKRVVEDAVDRSLKRMQCDRLDLLQFHWWDYSDKRYLDALGHLQELVDQGKIRCLGLTNFDTEHLQTIVGQGIRICSNQVQFSVLDQRPLVEMVDYCHHHGIGVLAYGTLCGGFISEKYVGLPEPSRRALDTASLAKYYQMIRVWGGWGLFQELLFVLKEIGEKYGVNVSQVAMRFVLEQRAVAGILVGARLGLSDHLNDNLNLRTKLMTCIEL